ncbi:hypothetical protein ACIHQR_11020 [Corallococcus coralloides]|uniref:hypothetical protein n=1 Tax=Corallococcus coralloides TaxID=184914 RepID=UPI00384EA2C1
MTLPTAGYSIMPVHLEVPELPFLQVIQVQPSRLDFDTNDYEARACVIRDVVKYLVAPPEAVPILLKPGALPPPADLAKPRSPFLACFPELYSPVDLLLDEVAPVLQPGQIISTGLSPLQPHPADAASFFTLKELQSLEAKLSEDHAGVRLKTPDLLTKLIHEVRTYGGVANLAATLMVETDSRPSLILHSKIAASKFERNLSLDHSTVSGHLLHPIKLKDPSGRSMFILPMICSDFIEPDDHFGKTILRKLADDREPVIDLISVLNVQKIDTSTNRPVLWPKEVRRVLEELAENRFGGTFQAAHVLLTNVGGFRLEGKESSGGHTSAVILGSKSSRTELQLKLLKQWSGPATLWGSGQWTLESSSRDSYWYDHEALIKSQFQPDAPPLLTQLRLAHTGQGSKALVQIFRLRLNGKLGLEAIQDGQLLEIGESGAANIKGTS